MTNSKNICITLKRTVKHICQYDGHLLTLSNGAEGPLVVFKERMFFNFFYAISTQANLPTKCKHPQKTFSQTGINPGS